MKKRIGIIIGMAVISLGNLTYVEANENRINRIHFINTKGESGSDAILLESNGHFALIDTGEDFDFPDGTNPMYPIRPGNARTNVQVLEDRVLRHLSNVSVPKLDFIIGTHVHSDHIGGVDEILNHYAVDKLYLKKYSDNRITESTRLWDNLFNYDNALKAAKDKNIKVIQDISDKDSHFKLGDMDIQLYNYKNEYDSDGKLKRVYDDNSNSIVAVVTVNGQKIYLGGDLDNAEGAEVQLGPQIGKVDLMKWNHHYDAKKSNTIDFLQNLLPSIVVQTAGSDINVLGTKKWLEDRGIKIIKASSNEYDATVFEINKSGFNDISKQFPQIPIKEEKWTESDGARMYQLSSGEKAIGWHEINGYWYFFNGKGHLQTAKWQQVDSYWYYLLEDGKMANAGWLKVDGEWYYLRSSGSRENDTVSQINGKMYLFDAEGRMQTGWKTINGELMFFEDSGALTQTVISIKPLTWKKQSSKWYYFDENKNFVTGLKEINGKNYLFDEKGIMQTGWAKLDNKWHFFDDSGAEKAGWVKDEGHWYYINPDNNEMVTGTYVVNNVTYYFNSKGEMQTGWKWHDGAYHYYETSGARKTGWLKENSKWYYLLPEVGEMATGTHEINGRIYYFNNTGEMQIGWKWHDDGYHYYQASGARKTGWIQEAGKWYYLEATEGIMITGLKEINGKYYYFNGSGEMHTGWKWFDGYYNFFTASGEMIRDGITPDGYKVDSEGRWLPNGVTTTTTSTTETTTAEETTQEQTTQETTVESTTAEPTTEQKTIPINSDKTSEITDANEIG